jgi:hypothetical protein
MPLGPFLRGFNGEKKNIAKIATAICRKMSNDLRYARKAKLQCTFANIVAA